MLSMTVRAPKRSEAPSICSLLRYVLLVRACVGGPGPLDIMSLPKSIKIGYAIFFDHIHTPELFRARVAAAFWLD